MRRCTGSMRARRSPLIEAAFPGTTADGKVDRGKLGRARAGRSGGAASGWRRSCIRWCRTPSGGSWPRPRPRGAHGRGARYSAAVRDRRRQPGRCGGGGVGAGRGAARARAGAAGHDRGTSSRRMLAEQMPDAEKRRRADFMVDTSHGFEHARAQVRAILAAVATMPKRRRDSPADLDGRLRAGNARDRARYRDHRASIPIQGASAGRDRLHRAGQPLPDRPDLPPLSQSRTRHAGRGVRGPRPVGVEFLKDKPLLRRDRATSWSSSSAMRRWSRTTRMFDLGFLNAELERCEQAAGRRASGWSTR